MARLSDFIAREPVLITYRTKDGEIRKEMVTIDGKYHSCMSDGIPFPIKANEMFGLVRMPDTGDLWATYTKEEYFRLKEKADRIQEELNEREAWRRIVEEEELAFHKHKPRVDMNFKSNEIGPYEHFVVFHNAFETNRKRH